MTLTSEELQTMMEVEKLLHSSTDGLYTQANVYVPDLFPKTPAQALREQADELEAKDALIHDYRKLVWRLQSEQSKSCNR